MSILLIAFCKTCKYNFISEKMNAKALLVTEISFSKDDIWVCMEKQIPEKQTVCRRNGEGVYIYKKTFLLYFLLKYGLNES